MKYVKRVQNGVLEWVAQAPNDTVFKDNNIIEISEAEYYKLLESFDNNDIETV